MGEESRARQRADSSGCKKPAMQQDKSVVAASFLLVVGILGVLMFAMADESQAHVGFQLVPEEETDLETVSDALTQVREDASYDFDDNEEESDFVQASSEWMWDRSVQARKKLGLAPRGAFKINPAHRSKREMEMARTLVHEASSRARSKIGLVDNSLVSFRTVGIRKSHPFSSLMKTADANAQFIKVRNAEALKGIQRIVAKLAKEMIKRAEQVQPPQLSFSQWMWEKKKSKAAKRASRDPRDEVKHLHMYDLRKRRVRMNRLAQKVVDEAEREQKVVFLGGDSMARAKGEMKLSMVNTASYMKRAKAHVRVQLKALIHKMSEAMINHVALEQHRSKTVKTARVAARKIRAKVAQREVKIARVKKALRKAKSGASKKALRNKLFHHFKKLHQLKLAHKVQVKKISKLHSKNLARKAHSLVRAAKKIAGIKSKAKKQFTKVSKAERKAYKDAVARALGKKQDPGDAIGAKKKVTARADCLQDGSSLACASEKIRH